MESLLQGLNEQQRCAVISPASVLQVLAPPGSGKTKTLTARVSYLISQQGMKPWNMIVCTFTIKAAREMRDRIRNFVGEKLEAQLVLGTFHSIARRYLIAYGEHIGIAKNFGIADSSDSLAIIKRITKRRKYLLEPAKARSRISRLKSGLIKSKPSKTKIDPEQQEFEATFQEYEETLRSSNLLDYDDLLLRCVELLNRYPKCVSNIEAVLIDEFQDTNGVQYELMSLFAQHRNPTSGRIPSISIVGDPDQSIYSFRSAEIKNLSRMTRQYHDTNVVYLEENYRSSGSILQAALEVIEQDQTRPVKKLLSTHCTGEQPILRTLPSATDEANWITTELQRSISLTAGLLTYSDYAILLRSASLSHHIERAFGSAGIPYRMVGGLKFFDRVEIKVLLDYLRVVNQPNHNDALKRVINIPPRKVGEATVNALLEEAENRKRTLWSVILDIAQGKHTTNLKISAQAQKGIEVFVNVILTARKKLLHTDETQLIVTDLLQHVLQKLSYEDHLRKSQPEDFDNRWANVEELIAHANEFSTTVADEASLHSDMLHAPDGVEQRLMNGPEDILNKFLANVALASAVDIIDDENKTPNQVTISTIHSAKGLEWPVVFIPAAYQGSIPHSMAEDIDEERRLLYVGMTRAKAMLYVSWPKKNSRNDATQLSSFLNSRTMSKYFAIRAPPVTFTVTQDLARILRRECPAESALQQAAAQIDRAQDDLWPTNGEEIPTEVAHRNSWNVFSNSSELQPPSKRQKISTTHFSNGFDITDKRQSAPQVVSASKFNNSFRSARASMQSTFTSLNTSGYGAMQADTINTGFRTALTVYEEMPFVAPTMKTLSEGQHTQIQKMGMDKSTNRQIASQANITTFFNKAGSRQQNRVSMTHGHNLDSTELPIAPLQNANKPNVAERNISNKSLSLGQRHTSAIPSKFIRHRLKMNPAFKPPTRHALEGDENGQHHILLPSSTAKPEGG